jgi:methanogenic corrinoid protein MtbC1
MSEVNSVLENEAPGSEQRERALAAFLYLGDKLKAFYFRGRPSERSRNTQLPSDGAAALFKMIEGEIVPRLMLAHGVPEQPVKGPPGDAEKLTAKDHEDFLGSVLGESASATHRFLTKLLDRGVEEEILLLDLLGTTARRLGTLWEEDRCSFTDVTIGLCRLHEVLRDWRPDGSDGSPVRIDADAPSILLATAGADQHVFGVVLVAEFFRRARWRVSSSPGASRGAVSDQVSGDSFDVLGLSAACSSSVDEVSEEIEVYRQASCNRHLKVMVGGRLFIDEPELVSKCGADGMAFDAKGAPAAALEILERSRVRC